MLKSIGLIFLGGGLGSVLRYFLSKYFATEKYFYLGTSIVNILGSALLGYFSVYLIKRVDFKWTPEIGLFVIMGFCGGFTTFSTFASENIQLFLQKKFLIFAFYILISVALSLLGAWLGMKLAEKIS